MDCSNYERISLLSTAYKISSNILLSRLMPYVDKIIGDHQYRFQRNQLTTNQIFCIHQILEKKWEYNGIVHQLLIDFKKAYDSVRSKILYNIFTEFGKPIKLVRLIKMCLKENYSKVHIGKHLFDAFTTYSEWYETRSCSKITVFWAIAMCSLVEVYQCFRGSFCLHHQGNE
jgi:hypothetical protein